jgi:hypothetical protein
VNKAFLILFLAVSAPAFATALGDSYAKVIAEKGPPVGAMGAGSTQILTYPDAIIKISDGVVVSIRAPSKAQPALPRPVVDAAAKPAPVAVADAGPAVWGSDFGAALEDARARNCHVLILYTGSDWCTWCKRMEAEVYSQPEFARYSRDKLVLLKLDYPRRTPQAEELKNQNAQLLSRYNVSGFPTALLVDAKGAVISRFDGYQEGGPGHFVGMLQRFE